jgi:hypothetical protein
MCNPANCSGRAPERVDYHPKVTSALARRQFGKLIGDELKKAEQEGNGSPDPIDRFQFAKK